MFRLTHISDTHGMIPLCYPEDSIMLVHSGDMFPNATRGNVGEELEFQEKWVKKQILKYKSRIGSRYFLYIHGNHDYYDPQKDFEAAGIRAINLNNKLVKLMGLRFYGFPYVPFIAGEWNYEKQVPEMSRLVNQIPECDVLVAHCPPYGILSKDSEGKGGGNSSLMNWLAYGGLSPRYILCGHFHESRGMKLVEPIMNNDPPLFVSNAATTQHTIEVE